MKIKGKNTYRTVWQSVHSNDKGFTLIEVLLAFFIFSIIFITIYTTYTGSFKTINMTEARMATYRKAAIVMERISEDLQASYISALPKEMYGQAATYTQFLGEENDINGQSADTLSFFSRIPPLFSDEAEAASGQLISYTVIQGEDDDELVLLRSENPEFIDEADETEGLILSDGLQAINFIYFDDEGETYDTWDSENDNFRKMLPRMVSISLEFFNEENPEVPLKVMTSVALAVDNLLD